MACFFISLKTSNYLFRSQFIVDCFCNLEKITDENINVLRDIFWKMNNVSYTTEKVTEKKKVPVLDEKGEQKKDAEGKPVYTEKKITKTILHIKTSHKTAEQQATALSFNVKQLAEMRELLDVKNKPSIIAAWQQRRRKVLEMGWEQQENCLVCPFRILVWG